MCQESIKSRYRKPQPASLIAWAPGGGGTGGVQAGVETRLGCRAARPHDTGPRTARYGSDKLDEFEPELREGERDTGSFCR